MDGGFGSQNERAGPFRQHEAGPVDAEGPAGLGRILVRAIARLASQSAFIVAKPLTTGGVNALSPAPQTARSASPDRRNIAPRTTACPPEAHALAGAALGP